MQHVSHASLADMLFYRSPSSALFAKLDMLWFIIVICSLIYGWHIQQWCCIFTYDTFLQTLKYHSCWLNQRPLHNTPRACIGLPKSSVFDWVTCIHEWGKSPPNASLTQFPITTHNQHLSSSSSSSSSSHLLASWCLHMPPLILWTHGRSHASLHAFLFNVHNVNFKK